MERQTGQTARKTETPKEQRREEEPRRENRQRQTSTQAFRAILEGGEMGNLPRQTLAELARQAGNSAMLALMDLRTPPAETFPAELKMEEGGTAPFPVGGEPDCQTTACPPLDGGGQTPAVFDPAGLR